MLQRAHSLIDELQTAGAAHFDLPVLLHGATGAGKSHLAELIHRASKRSDGPFVHVVDELDSTPLHAQAKLLLCVQKRQVTRLGSTRPVDVDVRIFAAMATDPGKAIDEGLLRENLHYRLAVVELASPPLKDRPADIRLLARTALARSHRDFGLPRCHLSTKALDELMAHTWPGNVRELQNVRPRASVGPPRHPPAQHLSVDTPVLWVGGRSLARRGHRHWPSNDLLAFSTHECPS